MSGTWPNFDASDFTIRLRHTLNELVPKFYQDPELWKYISVCAKKLAQRGSGVRLILDAQTAASTRTVAHNSYKCLHVEYLPSSGRPYMLEQITPREVGHKEYDGSEPQYWYEDGVNIGLDPLPDAIYNLKLYVSDMPKILLAYFSSFTIGSSAGTWAAYGSGSVTGGITLSHTGAQNQIIYNTQLSLTTGTNVTLVSTLSGLVSGAYASIVPVGSLTSNRAYVDGIHTFNYSWATANPYPQITMFGTVDIDDVYIWKEIDISSPTDVLSLPPIWNNSLLLAVLSLAMKRDQRNTVGRILDFASTMECDFLRSSIIDIIPDTKDMLKGELPR